MKNPELKKKVIRRDEILEKLEHEIARKNTKVDYSEASIQHLKLVFRDLSREIALERTSYWHKKQNDPSLLDREVVQERQDSPSDENALPSLNEETVLIVRSDKVGLPLIQGRPPRFRSMSACSDISDNTASDDKQTAAVATSRMHEPPSGSASLPSSKGSRVPLVRLSSSFLSDCGTTSTSDSLGSAPLLVKKELNKKKPPNRLYSSASTASSCASRAVKDRISATMHNAKHAVAAAAHTVEDLAETALGIQFHNEDGVEHDAGFVTFTKLSTMYAALSMVQHSEPWVMDVEAAPAPDSIFWSNVGRPHQSVQTGRVMGLCASFALIVVWTIPVSFIASLTDIETLKESLDFLAEWTEAAPWLEPALNQAAPLLILVLNGTILPVLLKQISKLEGPISEAGLNSSVFVKMAVFMFIQTFFVSAFSGSIVSELTLILEEPKRIMKILASSLPSQSTYFLQMALVATFLGMAGEMLRVVPIYKAIVRSMIGHNLTEKERSKPTAGFRPISVPEEICFSTVFSADMLFFVILLFFNSNAPMVNWIIAFCFLILESSYRYQIFHNRPKLPDSGGRFWIEFINILQVFIVVAQVSLIGFLATKNATNVMPVMVPLLLATLVFIQYVHQRHYWVALNLPANECAEVDLKNRRDVVNFEELKGHFLHPALRSDHIEIDWDHGKPKSAVVEKRLSIQNGDLIPGAVVAGRVSSNPTYDCAANGEMDRRRDGPSSHDDDSPGREQSIPAGTVSGILVSNNTHHPANFNMDCAQHSSSIGMERLGDNASSYSNGSLGREQHLIKTYHRSLNVERDSRPDGGESYYSRANPSSHDGLVPGGERLIPGTVVVGAPASNSNRRSANGESEMNLKRNDRSFRRQDIQSEYDGSQRGRAHLVPATVFGASSDTHHPPVRYVERNRRLDDRSYGRPGKASSHDGFRGTDRLIPGTVRGSSSNTNRRSGNGERNLKHNHRSYRMQDNPPSAYDGSQGTERLIPGTVSGASSNRYHHSGRTVDICHKWDNPPPLPGDGYPSRVHSATHQDTWDVERGVVAPKNWADYVQSDSLGKDAAPVKTMLPLKW